jgi:hypothetical protein
MKLMSKKKLAPFLLLILPALGRAADKEWLLDQSTLTYHVSHPLHQTEGVSHAARGSPQRLDWYEIIARIGAVA